jgi:transcription antitermination factor NusG
VQPQSRLHDQVSSIGYARRKKAGKTKGGEALTVTDEGAVSRRWHVLWTRSNCEQAVHDQLAAEGFDLFLPKVEAWSRRGGVRRLARIPMFTGYLFLSHAMDKASYVAACKARGLVRILGDRWDQLAEVPASEVEAIRAIASAGVSVMPYPYLGVGKRVRITRGPLTNVEGVVVRTSPRKGLLVVSVELLQRSVAVHLDCTVLEAA